VPVWWTEDETKAEAKARQRAAAYPLRHWSVYDREKRRVHAVCCHQRAHLYSDEVPQFDENGVCYIKSPP